MDCDAKESNLAIGDGRLGVSGGAARSCAVRPPSCWLFIPRTTLLAVFRGDVTGDAAQSLILFALFNLDGGESKEQLKSLGARS